MLSVILTIIVFPLTMNHQMLIQDRFKHTLLHQLSRYLHLGTHVGYDIHTELYITPWNTSTVMKIQLTLSWVEGHRVFYLSYYQILTLFKSYCKLYYPELYNKRLRGIRDLGLGF